MSNPRDKAVLEAIFNPLMPTANEIPPDDEEPDQIEDNDESEHIKRAKELELAGVNSAESSRFDEALNYFNQAVHTAPERASCYNNRAQLLRLKGDVKGALDDLNMAVTLSNGVGKAACQAHTQRGLIHRLEGDEEAALEDFKRAATLGGEFAKSMVVQMNPYAAMCNQMLTEVISKIRAGEYVD